MPEIDMSSCDCCDGCETCAGSKITRLGVDLGAGGWTPREEYPYPDCDACVDVRGIFILQYQFTNPTFGCCFTYHDPDWCPWGRWSPSEHAEENFHLIVQVRAKKRAFPLTGWNLDANVAIVLSDPGGFPDCLTGGNPGSASLFCGSGARWVGDGVLPDDCAGPWVLSNEILDTSDDRCLGGIGDCQPGDCPCEGSMPGSITIFRP